MSNDVWIGALISVPIGIATGVAVVPIQKWIENRGKAKALIQSRDARERYTSVLFYRLHPHLFTQYLLRTVIRTTFASAAMGIVAGFLYVMANATATFIATQTTSIGFASTMMQLFTILGQMTIIVASVLIINYCRPALKLWSRVQNFEEYAKSVPSDIRDLTAEALAEKVKENTL
jgi:hypothetical protein